MDVRNGGPAQTEPDRLRIAPSTPSGRRPRTSWIALGLLVLLGSGLLGAITVARVAAREPVIALAQPIARGEVLTLDHLTVVDIGTDADVALIGEAERDDLLGRTAIGGLDAGTLLSPSQFTEGPTVPVGSSVVGLSLAPGEYPTTATRPGDIVTVVRTPAQTPVTPADGQPARLVETAEVYAVEVLSETAHTRMVSIVVPDDVVTQVAAAAAAGRVRLALVGQP